MFIGGQFVDALSKKKYDDFHPATGEVIAKIPLADKEDVDKAVEAASKAFPIWSSKPLIERARIMGQMAGAIREITDELINIEVTDHGWPVTNARMTAARAAAPLTEAPITARSVMEVSEVRPSSPDVLAYLQREPIGVCAAIIPWNHPLAVTEKIADILATGNTCVVKPASIGSLAALKVAEAIAKTDLTPGVVNIITGPGGTVGEALASHPGVGMVSFVGGSETGKAIMAAASGTVKRLCLELGGKNPYIVFEDANLNAAVAGGVPNSFFNSGMNCGAVGRYYIHEKLYDEFVEKFIENAKKVVVGDPTDDKTTMGPLVSAEHRDRVEGYIKSGIEEGATLALGGVRPTEPPLDKGYFVMPTVFTNVTQNMKIAREEIFGPVAVFIKFSSEEEVIQMANDTTYGLSATIWTKDIAKGRRYANRIKSGTVQVNGRVFGAGGCWGGFKQSGFGKTGGILGQQEYTQIKSISIVTGEGSPFGGGKPGGGPGGKPGGGFGGPGGKPGGWSGGSGRPG